MGDGGQLLWLSDDSGEIFSQKELHKAIFSLFLFTSLPHLFFLSLIYFLSHSCFSFPLFFLVVLFLFFLPFYLPSFMFLVCLYICSNSQSRLKVCRYVLCICICIVRYTMWKVRWCAGVKWIEGVLLLNLFVFYGHYYWEICD